MSDKCGTYAGYQRHLQVGDSVCEPCRLARSRYRSGRKNSASAEKDRRRSTAYKRALQRLSQEHQARFLELYEEEKAR